MQVVGLTEACGRVFIEKNAYKSVRTLILLLSNVIDAGHQNNCSVFKIILVAGCTDFRICATGRCMLFRNFEYNYIGKNS